MILLLISESKKSTKKIHEVLNMDVARLDTGEILTNVSVTRKIPVEKLTNAELAQSLDQNDYKLSFNIFFEKFKVVNCDFKISDLLLDSKGNADMKAIGFFHRLTEMMTNYSNTLTFNTNNELIALLGITRPTFTSYMKKLKEKNLVKIVEYDGCKCLALNPIYSNRGYAISAPVFKAFKYELKPLLNPLVFEYYVRIYEHGNVIKIKSKKVQYL